MSSGPSIALAARLAQHLAAEAARPFDWREHNCCHPAARWVEHLTGRNPMDGLPQTADARAALRLVRGLGGNLRAAWTRQLGRNPVPADQAVLGDVVLFAAPAASARRGVGELVGVCCGNGMAIVADSPGSSVFLPVSAARCAWMMVP
jgi:hypothetical protein